MIKGSMTALKIVVVVGIGASLIGLGGKEANAIERQRALNWCWAASIQDVLAKNEITVTQEDVAARLDGWPRDRPARSAEVMAVFRSYGLRAFEVFRPNTPMELYSAIASGWKLVAFVRPSAGPVGHFIVLEGIDSGGNILVGDPAFGTTTSQSLFALYNAWHWQDTVAVLPNERLTRRTPISLPDLGSGWTSSAEATACLVEDSEPSNIEWHTSVNNPTVSFRVKFKNQCNRPIGCKMVAAVGNMPRNEDNDDWAPYSYKEFAMEIGAHGSRQITGNLRWDTVRPPNTMPSIRFPGDHHNYSELAACRFTGPPVSTGSLSGVTLSSFFTFAGISYGAHEADVRTLFGSPESVDDYVGRHGRITRYLDYFGGDLRIGINMPENLVSVIYVKSSNAVQSIRNAGINDPKLSLIGSRRDDIVRVLGNPDDISSDIYEYNYLSNGHRGDVSLSIYDFNDNKCSEISTHWYNR